MRFSFTLFLFLIGLVLSPVGTSAQFLSGSLTEGTSELTVTLSPPHPKPGERVFAELQGFGIDVNKVRVLWSIDGVSVLEEVGASDYFFNAPALGERLVLSIQAIALEGGRIETQKIVRSAGVDLVWEADTYTPPLYRGKALHTKGSDIRIVAFPHIIDTSGNRLNRDELLYTWERDGFVLGSDSGFGKHTLSLPGTSIRVQERVGVRVETIDGSLVAETTLIPPISDPEIILYQESPLRGLLSHNALSGTFPLNTPEFVFIAEPFFFSGKTRDNPSLTYTWRIKNKRFSGIERPYLLTLERGKEPGLFPVSVEAQHTERFLQKASATTRVEIGA